MTTPNAVSRRTALTGLALASVTFPAVAGPLTDPVDDSALLALEEQYFEQKELADSYTDEIVRLAAIWQTESERLYQEALSQEFHTAKYLSPQERWDQVGKIPECVEHSRLGRLARSTGPGWLPPIPHSGPLHYRRRDCLFLPLCRRATGVGLLRRLSQGRVSRMCFPTS